MKKVKTRKGTYKYQINSDHVVLFTPNGIRHIVESNEILGTHLHMRVNSNAVRKWIQGAALL